METAPESLLPLFFLLMPAGSFDRLELALAVLAVAGPC